MSTHEPPSASLAQTPAPASPNSPKEPVLPLWSSVVDDAENLSKQISAWTEDHHRQLRQATLISPSSAAALSASATKTLKASPSNILSTVGSPICPISPLGDQLRSFQLQIRSSPIESQVVTNEVQVVTNGPQVVTNQPQVVTNEGQVVTNSQPETHNPNVFNNPAEKSINGNGLVRFLDILTQQHNKVTDAERSQP